MTFHLEKAIAAWRRSYSYRRVFLREDLDELERHLRDHLATLIQQGASKETAFREAVRALGDDGSAEEEYRKVYWGKIKHRHAFLNELGWRLSMWKNYLKIALRNLRRQAGYSAINITGLAVGLACCLLILFYVRDEVRYDRFHEQADRIYRVTSSLQGKDRVPMTLAAVPITLGPVLVDDYPAIETAVRLSPRSLFVSQATNRFYEDRFYFADSAFFELFSFPLVQGDPATALTQPFSVVLTEETARKYFGDANPMGQVLTAADTLQFTVTGILQSLPATSHLAFDFLASFETLHRAGWEPQYPWWTFSYYTYLLLSPGTDAEILSAELYDIATRYVADQEAQYGTQQRYQLQPLTDIYLHSNLGEEIGPTGSVGVVYTFSTIALLILLIACINFTNLATARAMQRAREVGMRKVLGAHRSELIRQFLGEALLITCVALILALLLVVLSLPAFNLLSGKSLALDLAHMVWLLPGLLILVVVVGVVAGSYPAFALSRYQMVETLRGSQASSPRGSRLRKALVMFQFATSVVLLVGTAAAYQQLHFMQTRDLGFDKEQVIALPIHNNADIQQRYASIKDALQAYPHVRRAAASNTVPGRTVPSIVYLPEGANESHTEAILTLTVDADFAATFGLEMAAGRFLSDAHPSDPAEGFVLNEAAVAHLGWGTPDQAVGKQFTWGWPGKVGRVIGVVKDFHYTSLRQRVEPVVFHIQPSWFDYISLKLDTEDLPATLAALEATWHELVPDRPFDYFFLDEDYGRLYQADQQVGRLIATFAGLAILVACLGLFGLAAYTTQQRTKEIGVRKVLGATVGSIILLLSRDFLKLVAAGVLVALPLAHLATQRWLDGFAYHIGLSVWIFLIAGLTALGVAWLTVGYQAIRAATADPVKSLRYE